MGNDHDNRLKLAVDYLKYLGTAEMSPAQKEEEFYKLGCELSVIVVLKRLQVTLSGLSDNFNESVALFETILSGAVADEEALAELKMSILKKRADAKLDKTNYSLESNG